MKPPFNKLLAGIGFLITLNGSTQSSVSPNYNRSYTPSLNTIHYKIGETTIPIRVYQYGEVRDMVYINLHDDEQSSVEAARAFLKSEGGLLIKFENKKQRNIRFRLKGRYYTFDPNRMFSREGAEQTLKQLGRISPDAVKEVEKFGKRVLELIPENPSCVIALHNNSPGKFGVNSYFPGEPIACNAKKVYENPVQDPDDIFFTTDSILYHHLSNEKYNTIWQDNEGAKRDGSLSVYCGERNIRYVNCETEHGKSGQYYTMLVAMASYIERISPGAIAYGYRLESAQENMVAVGQHIYFGEEKVGQIKSVFRNEGGFVTGRLEISREFRLYSNAELFLLTTADVGTRLEIRIDPTREKNLLSASAVLPINMSVRDMVDNSPSGK